jgi:tetratricopeptide (TPR) repeat protein
VSLRLARALVNLGRLDEAVALLEPLRPVVDGPGSADEFSGPHLLHVLGDALSLQGRHVEAVATLRRAIELRDRSRPGTPFSAWLQETLSQVLVRAGRIDEAQRAAEEAERIERATGSAPGTARWRGVAGSFVQLHLARGEYDAARRRAGEVPATTVGERRPTAFDIELGMHLAQIELETGHDEAAARHLAAVRAVLAVGQRQVELPLLEARRRLLCGRWALAHAPAEAGTHLDRALDLRRRHLGRNVTALEEANRWLARAGAARAPADPAGPC